MPVQSLVPKPMQLRLLLFITMLTPSLGCPRPPTNALSPEAPDKPQSTAASDHPKALEEPAAEGPWKQFAGDTSPDKLDDLAPLAALVGQAQVIGLGESAHTSGGMYRLKHRAIRYMVEHMGVRAIAIESPWSKALLISDEVTNCEQSPRNLVLDGLYPIFASEEFEALMTWLCDYNATHPQDPVMFFGFDVQPPNTDLQLIEKLKFARDPKWKRLRAGLKDCPDDPRLREEQDQAVFARCSSGLRALKARFEQQRERWSKRIDEATLERAELALQSLGAFVQRQRTALTNIETAQELRDKAMADMFMRLWTNHGRPRTVLWAHNEHIRYGGGTNSYTADEPVRLGHHLKTELGHHYLALAVVARKVGMHWRSYRTDDAIAHAANSIESLLEKQGLGALVVDTRGDLSALLPTGWTRVGDKLRHLKLEFSGVLYLPKSEKMRPLHDARWLKLDSDTND